MADGTVERLRDHLAVEALHFEVEGIRGVEAIHPSGARIKHLHLIASSEMDPVAGEVGFDQGGWFVVNQEPIDHSLSVAVNEGRLTKNVDRVECWRCRQSHSHSIEVLNDTAVFGDVVIEIAEAQFPLTELPIQQVTAVALVDHD